VCTLKRARIPELPLQIGAITMLGRNPRHSSLFGGTRETPRRPDSLNHLAVTLWFTLSKSLCYKSYSVSGLQNSLSAGPGPSRLKVFDRIRDQAKDDGPAKTVKARRTHAGKDKWPTSFTGQSE
jgi:hypothetical protein